MKNHVALTQYVPNKRHSKNGIDIYDFFDNSISHILQPDLSVARDIQVLDIYVRRYKRASIFSNKKIHSISRALNKHHSLLTDDFSSPIIFSVLVCSQVLKNIAKSFYRAERIVEINTNLSLNHDGQWWLYHHGALLTDSTFKHSPKQDET